MTDYIEASRPLAWQAVLAAQCPGLAALQRDLSELADREQTPGRLRMLRDHVETLETMLAAGRHSAWVASSERLPTLRDADPRGRVWVLSGNRVGTAAWHRVAVYHALFVAWAPAVRPTEVLSEEGLVRLFACAQ